MRTALQRDYYFHEQRRISLEAYLQAQAKDIVCTRSKSFRSFLEIDQIPTQSSKIIIRSNAMDGGRPRGNSVTPSSSTVPEKNEIRSNDAVHHAYHVSQNLATSLLDSVQKRKSNKRGSITNVTNGSISDGKKDKTMIKNNYY